MVHRLSSLPLPKSASGPLPKVCVVSLIGASGNGGVGTATDAIVRHMARSGIDVTLLYTLVEADTPVNVARADEARDGERTWQEWLDHYRELGVRLERIRHPGPQDDWLQKSWLVKEFVGRGNFDVIYFDEWQGSGYYALLARQVGLAPFSNQIHCVMSHAAKQWVVASNDQNLRQISDLTVLGMERRSVEMADVVIGPSQYLLDEYRSYGWRLPERVYYQPLPLLQDQVKPPRDRIIPDELVFFGRLEVRKGLWLFCEALDRISERLRGRTVTFLGSLTNSYGLSTGVQLLKRSARWPFRVRLLTHLDTKQAQAYMGAGNRIAVIPSLADNSPCVIYECMEAGIPFVTTRAGGAEELIAAGDWPDVLVEPTVEALASRLEAILDDGLRPARPSFDPVENLATWSAWQRHLASNRSEFLKRSALTPEATTSMAGTPLLVMLDSGSTPVRVLINNLAAHARRFGTRANYLLITDRRGALLEALRPLAVSSDAIQLFERSEMDKARQIILSSPYAFFMDADTELLAPFFVLALGVLARGGRVVASCVGATRADLEAAAEVDTLPTGDLPALGALGQFVGGPVWALSPKEFHPELGALPFHDPVFCALRPAWLLGESVIRRLGEGRVDLFPIVGCITTIDGPDRVHKSMQDLRAGARDLGIATSLYAGGPAWYAISTFGSVSSLPDGVAGLGREHFSSEYLLRPKAAQAWDSGDVALLAAVHGRPGLALQLDATNRIGAARSKELVQAAVESRRQRPTIDLMSLTLGRLRSTGKKQANATADDHGASVGFAIGAFVDDRLNIGDGRIVSLGTTRSGGAARIQLFDVPVLANSAIIVRLQSRLASPAFLTVLAIDHATGELIGEKSTRISRAEAAGVVIDLPEVYGRIAIALEFSGADRLDLVVDKFLLQ